MRYEIYNISVYCIWIACPSNYAPVTYICDGHAYYSDKVEHLVIAKYIRYRIGDLIHEYETTNALDHCIHNS